MGLKGPLPWCAVKVKGLEELAAPIQQQGRTAQAERSKVNGVPSLGGEVVVGGWRPGAALVKGSVGLGKEGV